MTGLVTPQMKLNSKTRFTGRVIADVRVPDTLTAAYIIATVQHETGGRFVPVYEKYNGDAVEYFSAKYEHRADIGNVRPGDGYLYRGRGLVQLTGRALYEKLGKRLNVPLADNPDLAMNPDIAYEITIAGMLDGLFTGVALSRYLSIPIPDLLNARRVVNGTDKARVIAGYTSEIETALNKVAA